MTPLMHFSHHFFKGSCFQNVQGLSVFKVNFLSLGKNIQVLSLYSQRLHMHHIIILFGHFSFIYFFINLTFVMCNL